MKHKNLKIQTLYWWTAWMKAGFPPSAKKIKTQPTSSPESSTTKS